jgi:hypothetical protein
MELFAMKHYSPHFGQSFACSHAARHRRPIAIGAWLALVALLLVLSVAGGVVSAQELRTWTDSTGRFKIEGKLKSHVGGKVVLERRDGSLVEIELKKLSDADQKLIEEQDAANPFRPVEAENPFKPQGAASASSSPPDTAPAPGNSGATSGTASPVKPNWSRAKAVPLTPTRGEWKFDAPPAPAIATELKTRVIPTPPKSDFFEKVNGLALNASAQRALIGYALDRRKEVGRTRIVLCDLAQGTTLMTATTEGQLAPVALHDRGAQVLMRRAEFGWGNADRLELWNLAPSGISKVAQWHPYDDEKGGNRDVKWGAFLDDERFATLGGNGKLVVWDAESIQPLYYLQIDGGSEPALSPDRNYLAFSTGKQVGILDLMAREVVALQATEHQHWPKLEFSPDGSKLACLSHHRIVVWNFADGTVDREIQLTGLSVGTGMLLWPHEKYLFVGNTQLFDLANQVPIWTYRGHDTVEQAGELCAFVISEGHERPGALVLAPVPPPTLEKSLAEAMKQPDFLVLKPGVTVRLNLDALPDRAEREKVREALTAKLEERGFNVGPQGTIDLVATAEAGEERDVSYHGFGISPWKTYKVREYTSRLAFVYKGKTTWQLQGSSVPGFVQLKEGETIEQVLRRSERPNYTFYQNVGLPQMLIKPMEGGGLGTSQVTIAGVQ